MKIKVRILRYLKATLLVTVFLGVTAARAFAQEITGTPGAPDATTTIDGRYLPPPPRKFGGEINPNALQSQPYWPATVVPPRGAPNIVLIMTDDTGFGAGSTFGGVIPMPSLDRLASMGLRYTNMNSTALCLPSRAALITGRNHHSAGFGVVSEQATGFPGYDSIIGKDVATIGEILKDNGYSTSWFGKDHNTPNFQASQAGPFDQWPIGMGFEYFYGFVGGDTSQWQPNLFRNTTPIYPYVGNPSWNLITAMADDATGWMKQLNDLAPNKPFFLYYVPGATHAPHHPTPEWIKKISDMHLFDKGWTALREQIFANQKKLGVIPADAKLTPWPKGLLKEWDTLSADEKKLFIRQADVYAAYLAYTDHEIGRVIQAVEDMGKLDNTLFIYIVGDSGSSAEGTLVSASGSGDLIYSFGDLRTAWRVLRQTTAIARRRGARRLRHHPGRDADTARTDHRIHIFNGAEQIRSTQEPGRRRGQCDRDGIRTGGPVAASRRGEGAFATDRLSRSAHRFL
jgi:arylsulfatase